jgi:hypothetical protein
VQLNAHINLFLIFTKLGGAVHPYLREAERFSAGTPDLKPAVVGVCCIMHGMMFALQSQNQVYQTSNHRVISPVESP